MDAFDRIEAGDTRQFFVSYSGTPPQAPSFTVWMNSGNAQMISSATATSSSATEFYRFFTPYTPGFYAFAFVASFTTGPSKDAGVFQVVRTQAM